MQITNNFVALKHRRVVAAVLWRAQLCRCCFLKLHGKAVLYKFWNQNMFSHFKAYSDQRQKKSENQLFGVL